MKPNELMDALTNIDPSYIAEAAIDPKQEHQTMKTDFPRTDPGQLVYIKRKRLLTILLPAAACALLIFGLILPGVLSLNRPKNTAGMSDAAASSAASSSESADTTMPYDDFDDFDSWDDMETVEETAEMPMYDDAAAKADSDAAKEALIANFDLVRADYQNGLLTLRMQRIADADGTDLKGTDSNATDSINIRDFEYVLTKPSSDSSVIATGRFTQEPTADDNGLAVTTLDLEELHLNSGEYLLSVGTQSVAFEVRD